MRKPAILTELAFLWADNVGQVHTTTILLASRNHHETKNATVAIISGQTAARRRISTSVHRRCGWCCDSNDIYFSISPNTEVSSLRQSGRLGCIWRLHRRRTKSVVRIHGIYLVSEVVRFTKNRAQRNTQISGGEFKSSTRASSPLPCFRKNPVAEHPLNGPWRQLGQPTL